MRILTILIITATMAVGLVNVSEASIMLDFETDGTGLNLPSTPLTTSYGNITASAPLGGSLFIGIGTGGPTTGNHLRFDEVSDGQFAQFAFDFGVQSIDFSYYGLIWGVFTAQVLDGSFTLLDSFYDSETDDDFPGGPVTLFGPDIRYFRFYDGPGGGLFAGIDNVNITPVPEPSTFLLLGGGLTGLAFAIRRRKKE